MCATDSASRARSGVRGKSRKSASAATAARSLCQFPGSRVVTSKVVQQKLSGISEVAETKLTGTCFSVRVAGVSLHGYIIGAACARQDVGSHGSMKTATQASA